MVEFVLMENGKELGRWPVVAMTFKSGNTGLHASGQMTINGDGYNVNCLVAKKKQSSSIKAVPLTTLAGLGQSASNIATRHPGRGK